MEILFLLRGRVDQAWIRGGIARFEFLDALEIARIGDHDGEFFQLLELAQLSSGFLGFGSRGGHEY